MEMTRGLEAYEEAKLTQTSVTSFVDAFKRGWWIVAVSALVVSVGSLIFSVLQTPVYQSTAVLYVTSGAEANAQTAYQGSLASQQRVASYVELATSDTIVNAALNDSQLSMSAGDAKAAIEAAAKPETVLLTVSARAEDPAIAVQLVDAVSRAMTEYVRTLESPGEGGQPLAKLTVVTPGALADEAVAPRTGRNVLLGFLTGAVLGLVLIAVRGRLDTRVREQSDVEAALKSPCLGLVPTDDGLTGRGTVSFGFGATPAAEAFRKLRTNLSFVHVDEPVRRLLITSPRQGEGKTTTTMNLAAALAESGRTVVVVDADLRLPTLANRFGASGAVGLSNYLTGELTLTDIIQPTDVPGVSLVSSGELPPNPAEILGSQRTGMAIDELSALFDYVVVDSPPVLPVTDAAVLSQWVDGVVVVVRSGATKKPDLVSAVTQLSAAKANVLGSVLNDAPVSAGSYNYSYYGTPPNSSSAVPLAVQPPK